MHGRIAELDRLLAKEATAGRDLSEAVLQEPDLVDRRVSRSRRDRGRPCRGHRHPLDHPAGLRGAQPGENDGRRRFAAAHPAPTAGRGRAARRRDQRPG